MELSYAVERRDAVECVLMLGHAGLEGQFQVVPKEPDIDGRLSAFGAMLDFRRHDLKFTEFPLRMQSLFLWGTP